MIIGDTVTVLRRRDPAHPGQLEQIGTGLVIGSFLVQLDNAAARLLRSEPHRPEQISIADDAEDLPAVERIRPGLVGYAEADKIARAHLDGLSLLPVDGDLVYLELDDDDDDCVGDPWWCAIVCTSDCSGC